MKDQKKENQTTQEGLSAYEKAAQEGSITSQRIEDMQKWIDEPPVQ